MKKPKIKKVTNCWASILAISTILFFTACGPNTSDNETDIVNEIEAAENEIDLPPGEKLEEVEDEAEPQNDKPEALEREEAMSTPTDTTLTPIEPETEP